MLHNVKCLAAILTAFASSPALAKVIDFDLPAVQQGPTYSQDGFVVAYSYYSPSDPYSQIDGSRAFTNWIKRGQPSYNANGDNATLANNYAYMTNIVYANDNSIFSFEGISLADTVNSAYGGGIDFIFNYASGGSQTETVILKKSKGLQDFSFSKKGLISVAFRGKSTNLNTLQFDFLKVNGDLVSSVPETSTWALMLIGFGIIGYAARRTRRPSLRMQVI